MPEWFIGLAATLVGRIAIIIHFNIPLMMYGWSTIRYGPLRLITQRLVTTIEEGKGRLSRRAMLAGVAFPTTAFVRLARATANGQNPEQ